MQNTQQYENDIDIFSLYKKEVAGTKVLSKEEEQLLFHKYHQGDIEAKKKIIESNLTLVISCVKRVGTNYRHLKYLDLVQEGNIGLIEAVERFDPSLGKKFSTFAISHIMGAIKHAIANTDREIDVLENIYWAIKK